MLFTGDRKPAGPRDVQSFGSQSEIIGARASMYIL